MKRIDEGIDITCVCCGKRSWIKKFSLPKFLYGKRYYIYKCPYCGCGLSYPPPNFFYINNNDYVDKFKRKEKVYKKHARNLINVLVNYIGLENFKKSKFSLLDIGCGGGYLLKEAEKKGIDAWGIEVNQRLIELLSKKGLKVYNKTVDDFLSQKIQFDIIILSAVLEHIKDADIFLKKIKFILKKNGIILLSQATYDGLLPTLFPFLWYAWQPWEHYWHFTPHSITRLANRLGFKVVFFKRESLYYELSSQKNSLYTIGKFLAYLVAKFGNLVRLGDNFKIILKMD